MSETRSLWGLRLLALALAVLAWIFFSFERRERLSEKVIEATVRYENFPGLIVVRRVESVRVGLRGAESKMRALNPFSVDVVVGLDAPQKGLFEVPLSAENVFVQEDLEVVSIEPNVIQLELDREQTVLLPVRAKLEGEPAAGALVGEPEVLPPQVLVRGPESRISGIDALTTTPVSVTGHALDFQEQAAVLPPDPLITIVQPAVVTVRVPMEVPSTGSNGE